MVNGGGAFDSLGRVRVGAVVSGSLTNGLEIRLDPATSIEDIKVGSFVTMQGERQRYFGVVTDLELGSTDDSLRLNPPGLSDPLAVRVFAGTAAYGSIRVEPMLTVGADTDDGPQPAKTIPPHFSEVSLATEEDIQDVFGEEGPGHFWIGNPLDMETRLCLNIAELVKRSNGVFGKSGTGKTFLTRLLLMGILQSGQATNLVFDMQSEYGWMGYSEANRQVKGLKQIFESRVAVFSLDEESSRRRGLSPDYVVRIGFDEVEADDVRMLRESLNLSEVAADASFELERHLGRNWLKKFLDHEGGEAFQELASMLNVNQAALSSLKRRLARLERFGFMDDRAGHNSVNRILDYLGRGMAILSSAMPSVWVATMVVILPAIYFGWTPDIEFVAFTDDPLRNLKQFALPALIGGAFGSASVMRMTRAMVLEVKREDYMTTARSKGLRESVVITRHGLKNAMIPVLTVVGLRVPSIIDGSVLMEAVFGLPGMGRYAVEAIRFQDFPAVQGVVFVFAVFTLVVNLIIDLLYGSLDPRIRYS